MIERKDTAEQSGKEKVNGRAYEKRKPDEFPLPNIKFKDYAPLIISVVGNKNLIHDITGIDSLSLNYKLDKKCFYFRNVTDLKSFIDFSKISDLVIFSDLEIETFEFLSLINAHGFTKFCFFSSIDPHIIKKRIWKEVSVVPKVFKDKDRLIAYINQLKARPLELKAKNPFLLVEKIEGECLLGYIRGGPMDRREVHVSGFKDYEISEICVVNSPMTHCNHFVPTMVNNIENEEVNFDENIGKCHEEQNEGPKDTESNGKCLEDNYTGKEHVQNNEYSSDDSEDGKGLTKEDLERKYEKKKMSRINEIEMLRLKYEKEAEMCKSMFKPGVYVRVKLNCNIKKLKKEFSEKKYLLLGSIGNSNKKIMKGRIKAHKWSKTVIRSYEPVIISLGWYVFGSVPILSINDGKRNRYLKKNLEGYCDVSFFGPEVIGGFCFIKNDGFRVLGLGNIQNEGEKVFKKCKLIGNVFKSFKNSAFIGNMFNTKAEVKSFVNAKIKSVSGFRGIIKKPIGDNGDFRSTFEGFLNQKDTVFLKCYFPVEVYNLYRVYHEKDTGFFSFFNLKQLEPKKDSEKILIKETNLYEEKDHEGYNEDLVARKIIAKKMQFRLPPSLEIRLPVDKRNIIDQKIELPVAPEEIDFKNIEKEIISYRAEKNILDENARKVELEKEQEKEKTKTFGKVKSIIKSFVKKKTKRKAGKKARIKG